MDRHPRVANAVLQRVNDTDNAREHKQNVTGDGDRRDVRQIFHDVYQKEKRKQYESVINLNDELLVVDMQALMHIVGHEDDVNRADPDVAQQHHSVDDAPAGERRNDRFHSRHRVR